MDVLQLLSLSQSVTPSSSLLIMRKQKQFDMIAL